MTRVEFLRRQKDKTQKELAQEIRNAPCNIAQIERGHRKPWPSIREAIAEALGVNESDLFDEDGKPLEVDWILPNKTLWM